MNDETKSEPDNRSHSPVEVEAAKFAVSPQIYADDFIYQWLLEVGWGWESDRDKARADATEYYFADGDRSAKRLDALVRQHHPAAASRRLSLFEFASGYGCVSRHLRKMDDRYELIACDIHPMAVKFLREQIGVNAVLSCSDPRDFDAKEKFDVVFALSFFTHMPDRTFGAWIVALFETLADDGLLIFTTHGRVPYEQQNCPVLEPAGYWFFAGSEQKDLPSDEYGITITTPFYVMDQIAGCAGAAVLLFQEAFWWDHQDVFIVRKVRTDFRPRQVELHASLAAAEERISAIKRNAEEAGD
jgi:SAM-dependent methyltransferase